MMLSKVTLLMVLFLGLGSADAQVCKSAFQERSNFIAQHRARVADGVSPLLDELAFSPAFRDSNWLTWLEARRSPPDLSYVKKDFSNLKLADIIAKPGHMIVRSPGKITWFAEQDPSMNTEWIKRGNPDPAVINVITNPDGKVLFVDAWDGHHRLLGALKAGRQTLSELGPSGVKILINGKDSDGVMRKTTPPAAGVNFRKSKSWPNFEGEKFQEPNRSQSRFADVWLSGATSNWDQGSVFTLSDILTSNLSAPFHSVGVIRLHRNEIPKPTVLAKLSDREFHEILLVPDSAKDLASLRRSIESLNHELFNAGRKMRLNLYMADATGYISHFREDSFLRRIQEIYVTKSPPRFLNPETGAELPIAPLGYEPPL